MAVSGKDLELALLLKANADQAKAQLQQVRAELAGVNAESGKSAKASEGAAAASGEEAAAAREVAAAQATRAESDAEAAARIHAMVAASMEAVDAERARAQAAIEASTASRAVGSANATQTKSTAELVAAQNAQMAASSRVVAAQAEIAAALKAKTLTEEQSLEIENTVNRARQAGLITEAEQRDAIAALAAIKATETDVTKANTRAQLENAAAHGTVNSRAQAEIATGLSEVAAGNIGRLRRTGAAYLNQTGVLQKLMTPLGLTISGLAAAIGVVTVAAYKGEQEFSEFNRVMLMTGDSAGITYSQFRAMAQSMAGSGTSIAQAKAALSAVAATGKFTGDQLGLAAQAAVDMARVTGQSMEQAVAAIAKLRDDPVQAIEALDNAYHFLSTATLQRIQQLQDQGDKEDAANLAEQTYANAMRDRAQEMETQLGDLQKVWRSLGESASWAWDQIQGIGRPQTKLDILGDSYDRLLKFRMSVADRLAGKGTFMDVVNAPDAINGQSTATMTLQQQLTAIDALLAKVRGDMKPLQDAQHAAAQSKADAAALQKAGNEGVETLAKLGINLDGIKNKQDKVREAATALFNIWRAGGQLPKGVSFTGPIADVPVGAGWDKIKAQLLGGGKGADLDRLGVNAGVAAVQSQLATLANAWQNTQRVLDAQHRAGKLSDQDYFATLRKDLDDYTQQRIATLEQEKQAATAHVKTAADRIRADQQVAKIDAEITQAKQDAAAKREQIDAQEQQSIEKSRQEWEALRRSFETPAEVRAEDAIAQIEKLNKMLANGVINARQYHDALQQIGQKSVAGALPSYRGISGAVGGPYGELQKNFQAEKALTAAYEAQKLALKRKFNDQDAAQEQAHQAALASLDAQYAQKRNVIEQDRQQLYLTGAETFFDQLAQLSSSKNKTLATIGKAASIASTLVKAYQSGTEARAALSGIPYIGPALGIAAEAAAIAAGLANVAQMRAQNVTSGYATGGHVRGAGSGTSDSIPAMLSHGEYVVRAAAVRAVGVPTLDAINRAGFAEGGFVAPFADAPSPAELGFTAPRQPRMDLSKLAAANDARASGPAVGVRIVNSVDPQFARDAINTPEGETVILNMLGRNATKLKQMVR